MEFSKRTKCHQDVSWTYTERLTHALFTFRTHPSLPRIPHTCLEDQIDRHGALFTANMEFNTKSVAIDLLLVIVISSIFIQNVGTCPQESRSTESLRDVFIGRCLNFQMVHKGSFCSE